MDPDIDEFFRESELTPQDVAAPPPKPEVDPTGPPPPPVDFRTLSAGERDAMYVAVADRYLETGSCISAMEELGYRNPEHHRKPTGQRFAEVLAERREAVRKKLDITPEGVLREIACIAFTDPRNVYDSNGKLLPVHEWDDEAALAISSVETQTAGGDVGWSETKRVKVHDKLKALELLSRRLNLFDEENKSQGQRKVSMTLPDLTPRERARRIAFYLQESMRNGDHNSNSDDAGD